ncbi:rRNA-binding ribosome biosynthesis protein rpf2 [Dimargaris xerosporica]|nr:rRNA-binding ribosome biosynthesis protein rpf2 [Dimargaris xerosporica]
MLHTPVPRSRRAKRALDKRAPLIVENVKKSLIVTGSSTSEWARDALKDLHDLKKPNSLRYTRKNELRPFDDATQLEQMSRKNDTSLFLFGSHSKKRSHNLVIGRMFDYGVLDMIEMGIEYAIPAKFLDQVKCTVGAKPLFLFQGDAFEFRDDYRKLKNILVDFFHGEFSDGFDLKGFEHLISVTAGPIPEDSDRPGLIFFRVMAIHLKKSGTKYPRVELTEIGPALDLRIRRTKFADEKLWKKATRVPKDLQPRKVQNISRDGLGNKLGRIHLGKQNVEQIPLRQMKAVKKLRAEKAQQERAATQGADQAMDVEPASP